MQHCFIVQLPVVVALPLVALVVALAVTICVLVDCRGWGGCRFVEGELATIVAMCVNPLAFLYVVVGCYLTSLGPLIASAWWLSSLWHWAGFTGIGLRSGDSSALLLLLILPLFLLISPFSRSRCLSSSHSYHPSFSFSCSRCLSSFRSSHSFSSFSCSHYLSSTCSSCPSSSPSLSSRPLPPARLIPPPPPCLTLLHTGWGVCPPRGRCVVPPPPSHLPPPPCYLTPPPSRFACHQHCHFRP